MQRIEGSQIYVFSSQMKPIARAQDQEVLSFVTLDCFGGQVTSENDLGDFLDISACNPAVGPVYIENAEPGDVLAVDILDIRLADHGVVCTFRNGGILWPSCEPRTRILPVKDGQVRFRDISFPVEPMIGVIGVAGEHDCITGHAYDHGGNMDSRKITIGSSVYLPVRTKGALLAMGDVHAAMGDGEVCETGVEIAAEVTVRVRVIKDFELRWPLTETADAYYVNTVGLTCDKAIRLGYEELQRLIMKAYGWDATDATMYISLRGLVEANQAVLNENKVESEGNTFRVGIRKLAALPPLI